MSSCLPPPDEPPPPELDDRVDPLDEELLDELELELLVEYLVEVCEDPPCGLTSVPKSVQFSQTSSSAPSTLIVFADDVSAPHISHWTIPSVCNPTA
jgi:hypothetical protein